MYCIVKTLDGQHLLISHHKTRKEAEDRRELEVMMLAEWTDNVICHTGIFTNYEFKQKFPEYRGMMNHRHVHPEVQEILLKVNNVHHPFCNFDRSKPIKDCKQCQGLYEEYGYGTSVSEIMENYFPNVIERK